KPEDHQIESKSECLQNSAFILKMMENRDLSAVREYVTHCFEQDTPKYLHYHNLLHTQTVVFHSIEIGGFYQLNSEDMFIVTAAAWFHDLGYLYGNINQHEYKSVSLMNDFMSKFYSTGILQKVGETILSTRILSTPRTILDKI